MQRVQAVFEVMEAMAILRGDFAKVPNFCQRTKQVLVSEMGGTDSPANRKAFCDNVVETSKKCLFMPEACKETVIDYADPLVAMKDVIPSKVTSIVN